MSRFDDDSAVERGAAILMALQRYQCADCDHAALLTTLARPEVMSQIARCGSSIRAAYAWLCALVEQEISPPSRTRARGNR